MAVHIKEYFGLLWEAINEFIDDDATKLSASLAYYTIFSIGPLLMVMVTLVGIFFKKGDMIDKVYGQVQNLVGRQAADQVLGILNNIEKQNNTTLFGVIGIIILVFGATGVFTEIQSSI